MSDEYHQHEASQPGQEPFPYKTYDEILSEKTRRKRVRHGMVVMTGIFLLFCAIIIGISMLWNNSPMMIFGVSGQQNGSGVQIGNVSGNSSTEHPPATDNHFSMQITPAKDGDEASIYITDVSETVKKAMQSVVGVEAESYSTTPTISNGSGIVLSKDGYIITNSHVISGSDSITVTMSNGESYTAFTIGDDSYSDIAVLKIDASDLSPAEFGDSDQVEVGQAAVAIGNPTGQLQGTTTAGIISGINRNVLVNNTMMNLLQTDAAINAGNSGGPLLNQYGQVVGINSVKVSMTGYEGLGFAIPINTVKPIVEELVRNGAVSGRPILGITGSNISAMASNFYGIPQGIYVSAVDKTSDVAAMGLQAGDVITYVDKTRVKDLSSACTLRNQHSAGDTVSVTYYRHGTSYDVKVRLMDLQDMGETNNF